MGVDGCDDDEGVVNFCLSLSVLKPIRFRLGLFKYMSLF
jgi:hypothetical protein